MKTKKILLIIALTYAEIVHPQVNVTNTGTLKVSVSTDTLYVNGNFSNASTAALTNNGKFYIKQDLTNDQSLMAVGTGTLYLNGNSAQTVSGSQTFKTYNFVSNNSSGITLNNNLSVSGAHTFTAGLIATSATPNYLIYEAGSSYSGDDDSKHVNGWIKKIGNTNFIFPVGDATYERTAGVTNLSASSEINCKYYKPTNNIYNLDPSLLAVDPNEYWQIDKVSGGNARIALNWDDAKVAFPNVLITDIVVAHYTAGNWTDIGGSASGNVATTGNITSNAIGSFSPFTFGYKSFPVPLKLISFTGQRRSAISFLNWITENEQNVDHFEVQRSNDANNYTIIGTVSARNIIFQQHYDFEDHSAISGIVYYRLKSIDLDGKFSYSKVIAISEKEFQSSSFIVLNPVRSAITVFNKTGHDGLFEYRLFNASGKLITNGSVNMTINGGAVLPLSATISKGIYMLELRDENILFRQKLLIEK